MLAHGGGLPELAAVLLPALVLILVAWRLGRGAGREEREEREELYEQPGRPPGAEREA